MSSSSSYLPTSATSPPLLPTGHAPTEPYFSKAKKRRPSMSMGQQSGGPAANPYPIPSPISIQTSPSASYHRPLPSQSHPHPYTPPTSPSFLTRLANLLPTSSPVPTAFRSRTLSVPTRPDSPDSPSYRSARPRRPSITRRKSRFLSILLSNWGLNRTTAWRLALLLALFAWTLLRYVYSIQLEFSVYRKQWIQTEVVSLTHPTLDLTATCFSPEALARSPPSQQSKWNTSLSTHTLSHVSLTSTIPLRHGHDCFAFASTVRPHPLVPRKKTFYHTYWRADLGAFEQRQEWTIKSFLATQDRETSVMILWSNGDLEKLFPRVRELVRAYPGRIEVRRVDVGKLARGTALEGRWDLLGMAGAGGEEGAGGRKDARAWVDGDLVRLLVLWNYGGVWADMDMVFVRDLHVLLEDEWVTQWDCYDKPLSPLNGALLHFHAFSPYLCTFLSLISLSPPPPPASTTWGSVLYLKAFRRMINQGIKPFEVLPWCFADPRVCRVDKRVPDPFEMGGGWWGGQRWEEGGEEELKRTLDWEADSGVFTLHLHNQWAKDFPVGGWVRRLLLDPMDAHLEREKRIAAADAAAAAVGGGASGQQPQARLVVDEALVV